MSTATVAPFRFFDIVVAGVERLSPTMIRVAFAGPALASMESAGRDQRIKLFFPHPGQDAPVMPDDDGGNWYPAWQALDPAVRGIMRTYTTRSLTRDPDRLVVDFAVHGETGPGSRWALHAAPGDRLSVLAPIVAENVAYDFRPPAGTDWLLVTADETALPAVAGIFAALPAELPVRAWIEVADAGDRLEPATAADAQVTWLVRGEDAPVAEAVRAAELPGGAPYAWVAGESATVRAVRRHLVRERGFDRRAVTFSGYWRRGTTEDQLLAAAESA
ncbi:NADPH-dependent ferric siderophore reductase [Streptomyces sp. WAC 06738]|uniref:siderophore-interacting protein n=1 Tax=Streptomyces sp. WAC 06738 TaxID=2203210 RepID=UPI000F6C950E|nr:siderophore-interacting protein [Streptomyces sp. WAC 06738]AZM50411.1 NADPH-dependent ferric siderophore reductase [Streptomyces sp. WAC 06738]